MTTEEEEDEEFYQLEKQAEKEFRQFKRDLKKAYPALYAAVLKHEKAQDEKDILVFDLYDSKFAEQVRKAAEARRKLNAAKRCP